MSLQSTILSLQLLSLLSNNPFTEQSFVLMNAYLFLAAVKVVVFRSCLNACLIFLSQQITPNNVAKPSRVLFSYMKALRSFTLPEVKPQPGYMVSVGHNWNEITELHNSNLGPRMKSRERYEDNTTSLCCCLFQLLYFTPLCMKF